MTLNLGGVATSPATFKVFVLDSDASTSLSPGGLTPPASLVTGDNTFTASGTGIDLAANTKYFVRFEVSAQGNGFVNRTGSDAEDSDSLAGWSIADVTEIRDWNSAPWTSLSSVLKFAIEGNVIGGPPGFAALALVRFDGSPA